MFDSTKFILIMLPMSNSDICKKSLSLLCPFKTFSGTATLADHAFLLFSSVFPNIMDLSEKLGLCIMFPKYDNLPICALNETFG